MAQSQVSGKASDAPHNNFMMTQDMIEEAKKYGDIHRANLDQEEEGKGQVDDQTEFDKGLQTQQKVGVSKLDNK